MANSELVALLREGVDAWNKQRGSEGDSDLSGIDLHGEQLSRVRLPYADLSNADLADAQLDGAFLFGANLTGAKFDSVIMRYAEVWDGNFTGASLKRAYMLGSKFGRSKFQGADLRGASFLDGDLSDAILDGADLRGVTLMGANLNGASFVDAKLSEANLEGARLLETNLQGADLTGCRVYGISAWNVKLEGAIQENLVITPRDEPKVSVDSLEVAQFVYLLLTNAKIRDVIDTIGKKAVLILGRFTSERKAVLDSIRDALRQRGYVPMLFDFEGPQSRDLTETISTLAHLARFVIADLTDAKSIPQELSQIVPHLPSVPVQPLILDGQREYGMFEHFKRYPWVLPICGYVDTEALLESIESAVIRPAEELAAALTSRD